jgi:hypothetical protein
MIKDTVVMLSESRLQSGRVHNDPLRMCPARESRLQSGRETRVPFLGGTPSLGTQRRGAENLFLQCARRTHSTSKSIV